MAPIFRANSSTVAFADPIGRLGPRSPAASAGRARPRAVRCSSDRSGRMASVRMALPRLKATADHPRERGAGLQRVRKIRINGFKARYFQHSAAAFSRSTVPRPFATKLGRGTVSWQGRARGRTPFSLARGKEAAPCDIDDPKFVDGSASAKVPIFQRQVADISSPGLQSNVGQPIAWACKGLRKCSVARSRSLPSSPVAAAPGSGVAQRKLGDLPDIDPRPTSATVRAARVDLRKGASNV